jgi:hypothetical protein
MLMFLELSRPRGQVERWEKVFERLRLFDSKHPVPGCNGLIELNHEAEKVRPHIIRYMIKNHRVFMGADIHAIYKSSGEGRSTKARTNFLLKGQAPVVFLSPNAISDAQQLSDMTGAVTEEILGYQNMLPAMITLKKNEKLIWSLLRS